ncbi:MAG: hypothetical protein GEU78_09150 [Actinobacteria bacterium]|nr:hypothetical protein [Actinomycetota bacterium]
MSSESRRRPVLGADDLPAPLDLPNLARSMWGLYRRRLRLWVGTCFTAYLVLHAIQTAGVELFLQGRLTPAGEDILEFVLVLILVAVTGTVVSILLIPAMVATVFDRPMTLGGSVRRARSRGRHALLAAQYAILLSLLMLLPPFGFLFYVVGTEIILAMVAGPPILIHAVMHEGTSARDAWSRTKGLMKGQWLRIVMNMLTIVLGLGIVQFVVLQSFAVLAGGAGLSGATAMALVLVGAQTVFAGFALPLVFLAWFVSYLDARARADELTREQLRAEFDAQGAEPQAGFTGP